MSDKNRFKLLDGLAKCNILSKDKFQKFFPNTVSIKIVCSQPCNIIIDNNGTIYCKDECIRNVKIRAGSCIKIIAKPTAKDVETISMKWSIEFIIENQRKTKRELLKVSGFKHDIKNGDIVGLFIVPILSPWKYSNNIKSKFTLNTNNLFVNSYPEDCRN